MEKLISDFDKYKPKNKSRKKSRDETLKSAKTFFSGRETGITAFEDGTTPLSKKFQHKKKAEKKKKRKERMI